MAVFSIRSLLFLIVSILSLTLFIYVLINEYFKNMISPIFLTLAASLPYTIYMFFYEMKSEKRLNLEDGLINNNYKIFMIDTYCKYLFPFVFSMFFNFLILTLLTNFVEFNGKTWIYYIYHLYICFILPILAFIDLKTTPRTRNPAPVKDLLILIIICFGIYSYTIIDLLITFDASFHIAPLTARALILSLLLVNNYILYDYVNHTSVGGDYYVLFKSNMASPVENIHSIPSNYNQA
jgi:hypothetical protein